MKMDQNELSLIYY